ncbi:sodium:solute symporter family transporter [Aliamphritea hakodatensis]|uniref:sodium:solute symporter family transporter n=1 Tax=Aliamphritea hakodatensis TaxID=2895352 RepID=UPI0022FD725C|nr:sodium/solute symporter [Aliamphritea hakodatensis]
MLAVAYAVYLALLVLIGYLAFRRNEDLSDYLLGGRSLGAWSCGLSAGASDMGAWLVLSLPGLAMTTGFHVLWLVAGLLVGMWLNWVFVARRLRVYSELAGDTLTIPAYLDNRFEDNSRLIRLIAALFILGFMLLYTSAGLLAVGQLLAGVFGWDLRIAIILAALAVASYTLLGGFLAVSWSDVFQALLVLAALLAVPLAVIDDQAHLAASFSALQAANPAMVDIFSNPEGQAISAIGIISLTVWGLGYFGQPHVLARFQAISSKNKIIWARYIAVSWAALVMVGACLTGLLALITLPDSFTDTGGVLTAMLNALFSPWVAALLSLAVLAAIMSSVDSQLMVAASTVAEDCNALFFDREADDGLSADIGRFAVLLLVALAAWLAIGKQADILEYVAYAWAGLGATFGPVMLLSLYWPLMNRAGAVTGMLAGGMTVVVWRQMEGGWFELYELLPGIVAATLVAILMSKLFGPPSKSVRWMFAKVQVKLRD